jgi:hypothetical protein
MESRIPKLLGALLIATAPAWTQSSGAIDGYTLGFVFDSRTSGLKPLVGIPGAATLGAQLDAGLPIRQAIVSPRQNFAIALTDGGAELAQLRSATDPPPVSPLGFDSTAATIAALSPDGAAGAFYSSGEALIRVVTGLPDAPSILRVVPTNAVPGTLRLLAITNDAAQLVAVADSADAESLLRIDVDGSARTLSNPAHAAALQFIASTNDLLVADDASDTVGVVQDVSGAAAWQPLAAAADGVAGPVGLNTSLDGEQIVVANARAGNVLVLSPSGGPPAAFACPCTPSVVARLNGNAVFLLNGISDSGPLWIFDGDSATPRVVFVPAASDQ